jgi:hypothetical protein
MGFRTRDGASTELGTRRDRSKIEEGRSPDLGYAPAVTAAYIEDYKVEVEFADGLVAVVDLEPFLRGPIFEPLRDKERFRKFRIDRTFGVIAWRNGADIAPETLYEAAKDATAAAASR